MFLLDNSERAVKRVSRMVALIGLFGMILLASATVLDVLLRWLFNSPITGVRDASSLFNAVIIASCFSLSIAERKDITIRFLGSALGAKGGNILEAFGNLITMAIFTVITWQLWVYTDELAQVGEMTMVLNWPLHPWWRIVSVLIGACVPVQAVMFLQSIRAVFFSKKTTSRNRSETE